MSNIPMPVRRYVISAHNTPGSPCVLTDFDGLGVYTKDIILAVNGTGDIFADFLGMLACKFSALIKRPSGYKILKLVASFSRSLNR
ncbi:MAG: hypothetical protein J6X91_00850 [Bacteroidales bacterium]|nr:hypothetical protein [Bacteroidales bacterium]